MTEKQKAKKLDALKMAIRFHLQIVHDRAQNARKAYAEDEGIIAGFDKGQLEAYREFEDLLEGWLALCNEEA